MQVQIMQVIMYSPQQQHKIQQHLVEGVQLDGQSIQAHPQHISEGQDRGALLDQSLGAKQHLVGDRGMGTEDMRLADHRGRVKVQLSDPWLAATEPR